MEHREIWETYTQAWRESASEDRNELLAAALDPGCVYTDPLTQRRGHEELLGYMQEFQAKIPGGGFYTVEFMSHHGRSIARWEMRDGEQNVLGEGISYAEYDASGKLLAMTGFFDTPDA